MADDSEYQIGTTVESMVTFKSLKIKAPRCEYALYSDEIQLGDGTVRGIGSPACRMNWGFLRASQRAALRAYCPEKTATVFVRLRKDDGTFAVFEAVMIWMTSEELAATRTLDFTIDFVRLIPE